jgi:anti-sigma-K factor RskA
MSHSDSAAHAEFHTWDAAYVLGALSLEDRLAFEDHLAACAICRAAVAELAPLPGLLSRARPVIEADAESSPLDAPPINLVSLVERREAVRRHKLRRRVTVAVVSIAAAIGLAVAIPTVITSNATPAAATVALAPIGETPLTASVELTEANWGTSISMVCDYPATASGTGYPTNATYSLVITDTAGDENQVSTWTATPGKTVTLDAGTATPVDQIATIEVRDSAGEPVLSASV